MHDQHVFIDQIRITRFLSYLSNNMRLLTRLLMKMKASISAAVFTFGIICVIVGIIIVTCLPSIIHNQLIKRVSLHSDTIMYKNWVQIPFPFYNEYRMFNITNPQAVLAKTSKPILQELGPYTFRLHKDKADIEFNDDADIVTYKENTWFKFEPSQSNGSLTDVVTTLNIPYYVLSYIKDRNLNLVEKATLLPMLNAFNMTPFVTKTVDEILFRGYKDKFFHALNIVTGTQHLPNATFGMFYGKNNSQDDFTIYSGKKDQTKFLHILKWNNKESLSWWNSKYCNMINGSDGTNLGSFLKPNTNVKLFSEGFCRSIFLEYDDVIQVNGIEGFRFRFPSKIFASPDTETENECYCNITKTNHCLKSGAFSLSPCRNGHPVVLTKPHFYGADDSYYNAVIGLKPDKDLHDFYLDVEPNVGSPMQAHRRFQINFAIKPMTDFKLFANFTEMLLPILWFDDRFVWTDELTQEVYHELFVPKKIAYGLSYALLSVGTFIVLFVILQAVFVSVKSKADA